MNADMESSYEVEARDNGTLAIVEFDVSIEHGDQTDITNFLSTYLHDLTDVDPPNLVTVQSLLEGGRMRRTSDNLLSLRLTASPVVDGPSLIMQGLMQQFLTISMISGRFRATNDEQAHIYADAVTGVLGSVAVPVLWWEAMDQSDVESYLYDPASNWVGGTWIPVADGPSWNPLNFADWAARNAAAEFV